MIAPEANQLLTGLLRDVSRSFYKTLRVLPSKIRPQISLAYLLARTSDTVADTAIVPLDQRLAALRGLRERILGRATADALNLGDLARQQGSPAERVLLQQCEASLALLDALAPEDRRRVREVLEIIIGGQELDLERFAQATTGRVLALGTEADLDDYTYRVAGCVGEFWTRMCRTHLFPRAAMDDSWLLAQGVRFGKGLQLCNILRDIPADLANGRCYLPAPALATAGLTPEALKDKANEARFRPVYNSYLDGAIEHLRAGWAYTTALPWTQPRVRLACAWPILIGLDTLALLRTGNVLDPQQRIKVSRGQVKSILVRTILLYPFPGWWHRLARFPRSAHGAMRTG